MIITVTEQDIANGTREDCRNCAIARALCRETDTQWYVEDSRHIYCGPQRQERWFVSDKPTRERVDGFIMAFDNGQAETLKPIEFSIEQDEEYGDRYDEDCFRKGV